MSVIHYFSSHQLQKIPLQHTVTHFSALCRPLKFFSANYYALCRVLKFFSANYYAVCRPLKFFYANNYALCRPLKLFYANNYAVCRPVKFNWSKHWCIMCVPKLICVFINWYNVFYWHKLDIRNSKWLNITGIFTFEPVFRGWLKGLLYLCNRHFSPVKQTMHINYKICKFLYEKS